MLKLLHSAMTEKGYIPCLNTDQAEEDVRETRHFLLLHTVGITLVLPGPTLSCVI